MTTVKPHHSIAFDEPRGEIHFTLAGYWEREDMRTFLDQLDQTAMPLVEQRRPIRALGDMLEFVAQSQDTVEAMRNHIINGQKFGLERVAIVTHSALVKIQYRRLSEGLDVEFFDTEADAAKWLRRP